MSSEKHEHSWALAHVADHETFVAMCTECNETSENITIILPCEHCGGHVFSLAHRLCADCLYKHIKSGAMPYDDP